MSGQTNSFQRHMNVKITSTATSGPDSGRAIDTNVRHVARPRPPVAASTSSSGTAEEELPGHEQAERLRQAGQHDPHGVVEQAPAR